jgi:hypothetical protein
MQLSEVFRMGIVIPNTENTSLQMVNDAVGGIMDVKFLPISQSQFHGLWETGMFERLSDVLGERLVEYENICIHDMDKIVASASALNGILKASNGSARTLVANVVEMFEYAGKEKRSIYLIL